MVPVLAQKRQWDGLEWTQRLREESLLRQGSDGCQGEAESASSKYREEQFHTAASSSASRCVCSRVYVTTFSVLEVPWSHW